MILMIDAIKLFASVAIIERGEGMSDFYANATYGGTFDLFDIPESGKNTV
ncbi:hypothetical protein H4F51_19895 [Pectobacterium brasiliense]|nr:hypothetical protein [Pectobacterium brasiliense]MBA0195608.1 hypothetical protein [Pectobacterium brasiliense]MBN3092173.1 hypothetical protein [Pectobacterium brasiliense]MBN3142179.1 hypothetical protein [Pectobacterium brasiliense]MBW5896366.1 hypothetical protein [Pectobacterium brasiliense]